MNDNALVDVDDAVVARIRDVLAYTFPGQKFSVRKCDPSFPKVFNNVSVSWLDGPTEAEVRSVTEVFENKDGCSSCLNSVISAMNWYRSVLIAFVKSTDRATSRLV